MFAEAGLQRPATELDDQAGFLGQGNELHGGDETVVGLVPAHQRLEAGYVAAIQRHDGLKMHLEFNGLEGAAQVAFAVYAIESEGAYFAQ